MLCCEAAPVVKKYTTFSRSNMNKFTAKTLKYHNERLLKTAVTKGIWFKHPTTSHISKECPFTWKIKRLPFGYLPRDYVEADCTKCKNISCRALNYRIFVRVREARRKYWKKINVKVAYFYQKGYINTDILRKLG